MNFYDSSTWSNKETWSSINYKLVIGAVENRGGANSIVD